MFRKFEKFVLVVVIEIGQRSDRLSERSGHCLANYLGKTATAHVPTHVVRQYQPVICVIAVKSGFVVSWPAYINSRHPLYQFDWTVRDQKLMMRDLATRPSSDSEAATMYKLKGKSSNKRTGQGFKWKELVCPAALSSWSVQLARPAGPSSWSD